MSLFAKKAPTAPKKQNIRKATQYSFTKEELKAVEGEFDFSKIEDPKVALFVKYYILTGGNGVASYQLFKNDKNKKVSYGVAGVGANRMLRKIRNIEGFWDLLGLGYSDLKEVRDVLMKKNPKEAANIIMKVNKEDATRIEGNLNGLAITIISPPTGDTASFNTEGK